MVKAVHDAPWWAFNYYLGGLASRVVVNVDQPTTAFDLLTLANALGLRDHVLGGWRATSGATLTARFAGC